MEPLLDVVAVHAKYADLVHRSLQQLGVRASELDDLQQEVFLIVHKRLHAFDASRSMPGWLFGICKKVTKQRRRRAYVRREITGVALPEESSEDVQANPEESVAREQARAELQALLDELNLNRRAVLVMFEIDQMTCEEISEVLGVPVGTVHVRLHAARKAFQKALARRDARRAHEGGG